MAVKTYRGAGTIAKVTELTEKLGIRHPMIVGMEPLVSTLLKKAPALLTAPVFSDFHPNPDLDDCAGGAGAFRKNECDGLISVGGGSAIDTAKGIKAFLNAESADEVRRNCLNGSVSCPHIAIPGTAGTGSEATRIAVVYVDGSKLSLDHPLLLPEGVILDGSLLTTLPDYQKKSCALDALAQGIESYWANGATSDSRVHAFLAVIGVLDNLKAYLAGDPHAAQKMMEAAHESGRAINISRTTAAHAMSYQLTKKLGYAHGHACFLTLPILWERLNANGEAAPLLTEMSALMRLGSPLMGPKLLLGILYDLDMMPGNVPNEELLDELAASVNTQRLGNHPEQLTKDDLKVIYRRAFLKPSDAERQACTDIWRYYA
ncbi:MAG: phosphonoacetaldehyde reductase [Clostridia bacterium]|nr:phosphonoacetaldehyde reductase [Clostridia bacterium]